MIKATVQIEAPAHLIKQWQQTLKTLPHVKALHIKEDGSYHLVPVAGTTTLSREYILLQKVDEGAGDIKLQAEAQKNDEKPPVVEPKKVEEPAAPAIGGAGVVVGDGKVLNF